MDLQIVGRRAIVCAASKGLGRACAEALAAEGVELVINARSEAPLQETAETIRSKYGVPVTAIAGDITADSTRQAILAVCPDADILVTNAGGPPPGDFRDWGREEWNKALDANMLTPIFLIKEVIDGMIARKFGRIINITSGAVKAPIAVLGLSNGARSGLTGFLAGLARDVAQHGVTVNNLLPGPFETDRLTVTMAGAAKRQGVAVETIRNQRLAANPSRRFGKPEEFGAFCAFLASGHAGFLTGQNILLDGGAYPGTF
ncbi:SDR family oxidoreductase [Telmatospirillum sp.]|uniref:SDR family oxidoreductase n=1 Tax=Telmatospirillum sp. TaxID=2079197 RepID=UPI00283B9D12|nr:SDR family oxidoreductase [Telmatospirillum sp.]MDR3439827.1 SDR family oxidoreductase [Telmatospirillum sp.]